MFSDLNASQHRISDAPLIRIPLRKWPPPPPPQSESVHKACFNTGVVFLTVPASIYKVSEDIIVNEGSNVTLTCFANGRPEPAITWRLLNPSGRNRQWSSERVWRFSHWGNGQSGSRARVLNVDTRLTRAGMDGDTGGDDRAVLVGKNSRIFIGYCIGRRCFGHISSNPSVSCTWKLNRTDGGALSPLSVCVGGEPFVCVNPPSRMEAKAFLLSLPGCRPLLCEFKHLLLGLQSFARSSVLQRPVLPS